MREANRTTLALTSYSTNWACLAILLAAACGPGPATHCSEGTAQACACTDGRPGAQTCVGGSFASCVCAASDAGALDGDSIRPDAGAIDSGPVLDAAADALDPDAGAGCGPVVTGSELAASVTSFGGVGDDMLYHGVQPIAPSRVLAGIFSRSTRIRFDDVDEDVAAPNELLAALDLPTGAVAWRWPAGDFPTGLSIEAAIATPGAIVVDGIYGGTVPETLFDLDFMPAMGSSSFLGVLDAETGTERWGILVALLSSVGHCGSHRVVGVFDGGILVTTDGSCAALGGMPAPPGTAATTNILWALDMADGSARWSTRTTLEVEAAGMCGAEVWLAGGVDDIDGNRIYGDDPLDWGGEVFPAAGLSGSHLLAIDPDGRLVRNTAVVGWGPPYARGPAFQNSLLCANDALVLLAGRASRAAVTVGGETGVTTASGQNFVVAIERETMRPLWGLTAPLDFGIYQDAAHAGRSVFFAGTVGASEIAIGGSTVPAGAVVVGELDVAAGLWGWLRPATFTVGTAAPGPSSRPSFGVGFGMILYTAQFASSVTFDEQVVTSRGATDVMLWSLDICP